LIKNIIFDIGNVLLYFDPHKYLKKHYSVEDADFLFSAIFDTQEWLDLDKGTITEDEALRIFIKRNPEKEEILRDVMSNFYRIFTPVESTVKVLKYLKGHGYNLLYLSNIHLKIYEYIFGEYDFFKFFNGGIISAKVKMLKPNEDIFYSLMEEYDIDPGESVFIDDTIHNVETADRLGFYTIHLENPDLLEDDFEKLEIRFNG
jgi:putative hydrolase of the HAD superfamily